MKKILQIATTIGGVDYKRGADVADVATAGELLSLEAGGYVVTQGDKIKAPDVTPKAPDVITAAADVTPAAADVVTDSVDDLAIDTIRQSNAAAGSDPAATIDDDVVDLLIAAGLVTIGDARSYLADHGHFRRVKGIGKATSPRIESALALLVAATK